MYLYICELLNVQLFQFFASCPQKWFSATSKGRGNCLKKWKGRTGLLRREKWNLEKEDKENPRQRLAICETRHEKKKQLQHQILSIAPPGQENKPCKILRRVVWQIGLSKKVDIFSLKVPAFFQLRITILLNLIFLKCSFQQTLRKTPTTPMPEVTIKYL